MTDKDLRINTDCMQKDSHHSYYNHRYEPTSYEIIENLFDQMSLQTTDCFVDYGCGKGRLNFYINHRFHCKSIGIELNEEFYQDALMNLQTYRGIYKDKLSFYCMPAQDYKLNGDETIFYFFNPFSVEIFSKVIHKIYDSIVENPRECFFIYHF